MSDVMMKYGMLYLQALYERPIRTKVLTATVTSVLSSLISNRGVNSKDILVQSILGAVYRGLPIHYWYILLDDYMFAGYDASFRTAVLKVICDQVLFAPVYNYAYFYVNGMVRGESFAAMQQQASRQFADVMRGNYKLWPLVNLINFALVPAPLRVFFGNIVAVFWNAYIISVTRRVDGGGGGNHRSSSSMVGLKPKTTPSSSAAASASASGAAADTVVVAGESSSSLHTAKKRHDVSDKV